MAKPIESTPPLEGEDAGRLLADLEKRCSPEEMRRRVEAAKKSLDAIASGKIFRLNLTE